MKGEDLVSCGRALHGRKCNYVIYGLFLKGDGFMEHGFSMGEVVIEYIGRVGGV